MHSACLVAEPGPSAEAAFGGPRRGAVASVSPLLRFTPVSGWHCLFKGKFQRKQIKSE